MNAKAGATAPGTPLDFFALPAETVKAIAELAKLGQNAEIVEIPTEGLGDGLPAKVPALFNRSTQALVSVEGLLEEQRLKPDEIKGTAKTTTLASLIALIDRHKTDESVVFANTEWPNPSITAVIDYHTKAHKPDWLRHRIHYAFPLTEEIKVWIKQDSQAMEQGDFAAFLEEHAAELSSPTPAEKNLYETLFKAEFANPNQLIDLSRELEVHVGARVKRAERLQTGERTVEFVEEHTDGRGARVTIPGIFMINVRAFVDGVEVRIPARLRYRIQSGSIVWFYQMYRWDRELRQQVLNDLAHVGEKTALPTYEGSPEA